MYLFFLLIIALAVRKTASCEIGETENYICGKTVPGNAYVGQSACPSYSKENTINVDHYGTVIQVYTCRRVCDLEPCKVGQEVVPITEDKVLCRCKSYVHIPRTISRFKCSAFSLGDNDVNDPCYPLKLRPILKECEYYTNVCEICYWDSLNCRRMKNCPAGVTDNVITVPRQDTFVEFRLCSRACQIPRCPDNRVAIGQVTTDHWETYCRCKEYNIQDKSKVKCSSLLSSYDDPCST